MNSSRTTLYTLIFAVLSTATLAFATQAQHQEPNRAAASTAPMQVIELPRVEVTGHRIR
ncbi:MAG: hypothetical protein M3Y55_00380 [Pseudomonadota bacterium]|nr:hypothetical protein [Pseudomonadota bacterium]